MASVAPELPAVGSSRVPTTQAIADAMQALLALEAQATDAAAAWNCRLTIACALLAQGTGLRPVELARVRAADISLDFGVLVVTWPKAQAPRVVPLGPTLVAWLAPLVRGLRRTGPADTRLLQWWTATGMNSCTVSHMEAWAVGAIAPTRWVPLDAIALPGWVPLGDLRHWNITHRGRADRAGPYPGGPLNAERGRSASRGHGQTGGWDPALPCRFRDEQTMTSGLQELWIPPATPPAWHFEPPPVGGASPQRAPRAAAAGRRRPPPWVLAGLTDTAIPLDELRQAHARLWEFGWVREGAWSRAEALAIALAFELLAFGDVLVPDGLAALQGVTGEDWETTANGVRLWVRRPGHRGALPIMLGPGTTILWQELRQIQPPTPFGTVNPGALAAVGGHLLARPGPVPVEHWRQANRVAHLLSHTNEQVGVLQGQIDHTIARAGGRPARPVPRPLPLPDLAPLAHALRTERPPLSRVAFVALAAATVPDWGPEDEGRHSPEHLVLASVLTSYARRRRRSRAAYSRHTLRSRIRVIAELVATYWPDPTSPPTTGPTPLFTGPDRAAQQQGLQLLTRTCARLKLPPPCAGRSVSRQPYGRHQEIRWRAGVCLENVWSQVEQAPAEHRPWLALYAIGSQLVRETELWRLYVRDLTISSRGSCRFWVVRGKGGRTGTRWVRIPEALRAAISEVVVQLRRRDPAERLFAPLGGDRISSEGLAGRVGRRVAPPGTGWRPHAMRAAFATAEDRAGTDRAEIAHRFGHARVNTVTEHYVDLDLVALHASAMALSQLFSTPVSIAGLAWVRSLSRRQAERVHAQVQGDLARLVAESTPRRSQRPPTRSVA
ncbi:MAG: tyrosine-type recombinase/integrase [Candidatus Dormibacteria bacterium]